MNDIPDIQEDGACDLWRELGFYYDYNETAKSWDLFANRKGFLNLAKLLREYAEDPAHDLISEHEHFGPYMYFEVMTDKEPQITTHAIAGTLQDILKLANLIETKISKSNPGQTFEINEEYAPKNEVKLVFRVQKDDFDPSSLDPYVNKTKSSANSDNNTD